MKSPFTIATTVTFVLFGSATFTSVFAGGWVNPIQDVPPVIYTKPVQIKSDNSWAGPYAGLSWGKARTKTTQPVYESQEITEPRQETRPFTKTDLHHDLSQTGCADPDQVYTIKYPSFAYQTTCASIIANTPDAGWAEGLVDGYPPVIVREWTEVTGTESVQTGTITQSATESFWGGFLGYRYQTQRKMVLGVEASYDSLESVKLMGQVGYGFSKVLPYATAGFDFKKETPLVGVGVDVSLGSNLFTGVQYLKETQGNKADKINARIGWRF